MKLCESFADYMIGIIHNIYTLVKGQKQLDDEPLDEWEIMRTPGLV